MNGQLGKGAYTKMEDPWGSYVNGKTGNGYARITLLEDPSQNNLLKDIELSSGAISPAVDYETDKYIVELNPEDTEITITGIADDKTATVEGNGTFDVPAGENKIELKVTAQNGDIKIYEITIKRKASSNAKPVNITIDGLIDSIININPEKYGILIPESFDPNIHEYSMIVPNKLKKLIFNVEKGHKYQTVTGDGEHTLEIGENTIEIEVTSEDKLQTEKYIYHIERDLSGNAALESLSVTNVEKDIDFDPEILEYYLIVPNEIDHLEIEAIPEVKTLTPVITGNTNLVVGLNDVKITVTAENGESLIYIIHAYRMMSGNTFLSDLKVYNDTNLLMMTPTFNKILDTYKVVVPNNVDKVNIVAIPEVSTTTIIGDGIKNLQTGVNIFSITTTAEDGSQDSYTIMIEREKSNNNYLKSLTAEEGAFTEEFDKNTQSYHIEVGKDVNSLKLAYEVEDSTAKVIVLDNRSFKAGENIVTIRVTAENGTSRDYIIIVNRIASDNNYLLNLWTDKGELSPEFNKEVLEYRIEVENELARIKVFATNDDLSSKIIGTGEYALDIGENLITVSVMAENADIRNYNITVFRKQNNNTNLLRIDNNKGAEVNKVNDTTYRIQAPNEAKEIIITGIPESETSNVKGNGKKQLIVGENTFTLTVTAEDGSIKDYTVIVTRSKSSNANLKSLFIKESDYSPELTPEEDTYYTKVLYNVSNITMEIETEDEGASFEVIGNQDFKLGQNDVIIRVTASDGVTMRDYKIVTFVQELNTGSNYLYSLAVNKGILTPEFDKEKQVYEVTVPYLVNDIEVTGIPEDVAATITGTGEHNLEVRTKYNSSKGYINRQY